MRVLVTGGLGLVGSSVTAELLAAGHTVRVFDRAASDRSVRRAVRLASGGRKSAASGRIEAVTGDLCNIAEVGEAVRNADAVIHLAALIPPASDRLPGYARYVNAGGTRNIVEAMERSAPAARLLFTSSIAVYGDRRARPLIRVEDATNPGEHGYAAQKLEAESIVRNSKLDWSIFRLSYIVSPRKLTMDPLMFEMPLETSLEVCTVGDTARALARAVTVPGTTGRTLHIAGGPLCRTTYRDYLDRMAELFGLGQGGFPAEAFSTADFHCGFMDTAEAQTLLRFQSETLEDYYRDVARTVRLKRPLLRLARTPARSVLLQRSRHWREARGRADGASRPGQIGATRRTPGRSGWSGAAPRAHPSS